MNHSDEVLDRLLKGLRDAEPPRGMEARILRAMESPAPARMKWRLCAAVAACVSLAAAWAIATIKLPPLPGLPMYNPQVLAMEIASKPAVHRARAVKPAHATPVQLASFPAPPLPLTDQEKLLLRFAHRPDASNSAALNPAAREAQMAKSNEQFQHFFDIDDKEMRNQIE
jgi:hypothetical protein